MNSLNNLKFIYEKPKKYNIVFGVYILLIFFLVIFGLSTKNYSKLKVKATSIENKIIIPIVLENTDVIEKSSFFKVDDKKYKFKILEYGKIYNDGDVNIQDILISSNISNKLENQVFELTFYYDEELLIKKIVKGVLK